MRYKLLIHQIQDSKFTMNLTGRREFNFTTPFHSNILMPMKFKKKKKSAFVRVRQEDEGWKIRLANELPDHPQS